MRSFKRSRRWMSIALVIALIFGTINSAALAADAALLDQEQAQKNGNVWVNKDYPRSQTFTPAVAGNLDKIELYISGSLGTPGAIRVDLYREGDSTLLAQGQSVSGYPDYSWVTVDFSGTPPYLKKDTMYKMVVSTENGTPSGWGWYGSSGDVYKRGSSEGEGYDFAFRTYMIADHSVSEIESEIMTASSLVADGSSQTPITVKLRDVQGNEITSGGETVAVTSTLGTVGPVTDNGDGTYTATLTAPTAVGTATVSASVGGKPLTRTAAVQLVAGAPSAETSTVETAAAVLPADGTRQTVVTVKLRDAYGNELKTGGAAIAITSTSGTVSPVTDNGDGTYTARLTAPTEVGTATVSASVGGTPLASTASVQFVVGAPSKETSTIEAADATLPADGTSHTEITVRLKDAQGRALTSGGAFVFIDSTLGEVTEVRDNEDGTYTARLTAPTEVGTAEVRAFVNERPLTATTFVEFLPGEVSATHSTLTASDLVVRADGSSNAQILVTLKDDYDHPLAGKKVKLEASGGQSYIEAVSAITDENGTAKFLVINTAAEEVTYTAKDEISGTSIDQSVKITFTYDQPPTIGLIQDPIMPTFESVSITVTALAYGQLNKVAVVKWAPGNQQVSYFEKEGTVFTDRFTVEKNGVYSIYAADTAGNANVRVIEISNIIPKSINNNLSGWQVTGVGGTLGFNFDPERTSYSIAANSAVNGLKMLLTSVDSHAVIYVNESEIKSGVVTDVYSLVTGTNTFVIRVKAQDGSMKTYKLLVVRSSPTPNPDPGSSSGSSGAGASSPSSPSSPTNSASKPEDDDSLKVRVNGTEISGIAKLAKDANGAKYIDIELKLDALRKVLDSLPAAQNATLAVSVEKNADRTVLRVPGEVVGLLSGKSATVILTTSHGQYRLPLAEVVKPDSVWPKDAELQLSMERGELASLTGLQAAASKSGLKLVSDPIGGRVYVARQGEKKEITSFGQYVEQIMYLPDASAKAASTVVMWDGKEQGLRPVPTKFAKVDGKPAAVVRSLTNSAYVLVSKPAQLTDLQGHWAADEIRDMNSRLIVQGIDDTRFAPEAAITRAELATLLSRALGLPEGGGESSQFRDVSPSSWYSGAVAAVHAHHIMDGMSDGAFAPNQKVSRQEAIVTIIRALQFTGAAPSGSSAGEGVNLSAYSDGGEVSEWAKAAIATAIQQGLVKGYGKELRPQKLLTRAETSVLLYRMLEKSGMIGK
ncbi:invasin domain 3-containing protein [Paenibacillus sp. J22TS3]|uniref:invasin domain 3-containing protein n=1 Tax=Paenibacillus sp. J22TS3 TaxID=2807192 RepID=UPI001BCD78D8|nr:invasin domain 3-containing protein [Paenibacillus sp. J22TS3]